MPVRQDTFTLIPTTLVNTGPPRPPMTSKAVKKAYREANRLPKISKAEQRRIDAEELARQKREWEREKAAAKAKVVKEKKRKKDEEQKEKRKKLGLPEPSRFVRASQPTIRTFVRCGLGKKRSREEADIEDPDSWRDGHRTNNSNNEVVLRAKRIESGRVDDDDDFGDFPSLTQVDLPGLFAEPETCPKQAESPHTSHSMLLRSPPSQRSSILASEDIRHDISNHVQSADEVDLSAYIYVDTPDKVWDETTRAMPSLPLLVAVTRLRPRDPLSEVSRNMAPPSRPKYKTATTTTRVKTKLMDDLPLPLPSTQAFLEANLDDFFPSPSQQVRELLDDVDDVPSNTQVAREIEQVETREIAPQESASLSISRPPEAEEELLLLLTSQDLEISLQDLEDIDTPSKVPQISSPGYGLKAQSPVKKQFMPPAPSHTPKVKPRFFEEKEDDLLHAALHESLLLAKQCTKSSTPRRSQRILRRTQSNSAVPEEESYWSDGSDMDPELLALLDKCDTASSTACGNEAESTLLAPMKRAVSAML